MNETALYDAAIELLIIDDSRQKADECVTALRNAGIAAHLKRIDSKALLLKDTLKKHFDIALFTESSNGILLEQAITLFQYNAANLPLIILTPEDSEVSYSQLMGGGVRDVVAADDMDHLKLVVLRELSDLKVRKNLAKATHALSEAENRCTALIDSSRAAIAYVHEGMHIRANPTYMQLFGCTTIEDIEGLPILELIAPNHLSTFKKLLRSLPNSANKSTRIECLRSTGEIFTATLEFAEASIDGEPCTQVTIRDRTIQSELEEKLDLLSNKDTHTGLYNRQYFFDKLEATTNIALDNGPATTLYYIILDDFQETKNRSGVVVADAIIIEIGNILEPLASENNILARFGDHTFTLLVADQTPEEIEALAERICTTIRTHKFSASTQLVSPTCSIGITTTAPETTCAQDMLNLAYHACESARQSGGDQFAFSVQSEGDDEANDENDLSQLIEHALTHDRFQLVYQPIVSLQGDTRENYAALVRLLDSNDEEIQPHHFLKQAEQLGRMVDIDRWIIRKAIATLSSQRKTGRKVNFFINISASSLNDEGLLLWICDCLREFEAKGPWITLQISESTVRNNIVAARQLSEGLQKIKCSLAIDHFGLSPEPEKLLNNLSVNLIMFAPGFMHDLASHQEKQDTLDAVNKLAHTFDIKTVATGVEDASSLAILWTIGVNYIRGYFLQEPSHSLNYDFNYNK